MSRDSVQDEKILDIARKRFDRAVTAESLNRQAAVDDLKFKAGEQWDAGIKAQRESDQRPCLTVNKMLTFVHQVTNDQRQNRPSINVSPLGDSDKVGAQMRQGLIRQIERESDADIAYDTGFDNSVSNGFGYWRVITDYEGEDTFNQVLRLRRIRNPFTVYLDPDRQQPDGSDSMWGFVTEKINRDEFKRLYPDVDTSSWDTTGIGDSGTNWYEKDTIRVAEYFTVDLDKKTLVALKSGHVGYQDDLAPEIKAQIKADPGFMLDSREVEVRTIKWYKMTAHAILEETPWAGKWIPIIECVGDEIDIEGRVVKSGVVRHAKGPQQMYNYWVTAKTEVVALAPKAPWVAAEGQIEGHPEWMDANRKSYSVLSYKPTDVSGHLVPPPQRQGMVGVPAGMIEAQQSAAEDMQATTGIRFTATRTERFNEESGVALKRLEGNQQLGAFHYIDNFARSLRHTGRILLDLIPHIYDTQRIATILGNDGKERRVMLNPQQQEGYKQTQHTDGKPIQSFNVNDGKYEVAVTIGPNYTTKRQEASAGMMEFAKSFPNKADLVADLVAKEQDWPGSDEISKRLAMSLPPGMLEPDESDLSPQTQALIQSLQQQSKQMQQQIQAMGMALEEKQAELQIKAEKNEQDYEVGMVKNMVDAQKAQMDHFTERMDMFLSHLQAKDEREHQMELAQQQAQQEPAGAA